MRLTSKLFTSLVVIVMTMATSCCFSQDTTVSSGAKQKTQAAGKSTNKAASTTTVTEGRAVWVTRWQFKNADDIRHIMDNIAAMHFNTVLFQVRGEGTAFYKSEMEPWAWELTSDSPATTGKDPGWDPLQVAVEEAHKRDLKIHAWMNVFPGWRGQTYPPKEAKQLWTEHPDWFMRDKSGKKMIPRDATVDPSVGTWYSFLNPAHPRVQDYIPKVFLEVVKNYDVDGIHYDYVRYPGEIDDFSYDPASLGRFKEETGGTPESDPQGWIDWRSKQVTDIVRTIYQEATKLKPGIEVSSAVIAGYERAYSRYFARSQEWLKEGIIDIAIPMNYGTGQEFEKQTRDFVKNRSKRHIYVGLSGSRGAKSAAKGGRRIGGTSTSLAASLPAETTPDTAVADTETTSQKKREVPELHRQIAFSKRAKAQGVSVFAYSSLVGKNGKINAAGKALAAGPFRRKATVPRMPWKEKAIKEAAEGATQSSAVGEDDNERSQSSE